RGLFPLPLTVRALCQIPKPLCPYSRLVGVSLALDLGFQELVSEFYLACKLHLDCIEGIGVAGVMAYRRRRLILEAPAFHRGLILLIGDRVGRAERPHILGRDFAAISVGNESVGTFRVEDRHRLPLPALAARAVVALVG